MTDQLLEEIYKNNSHRSFKIGIVHTRENRKIVDALVNGAIKKLKELGIKEENIFVDSVPGAFELPFGTMAMLAHAKVDTVISIECLFKGSTANFEYSCDSVSHALMDIQFKTKKPVIFGVLTCLTEEQAQARAGLIEGTMHNHDEDWGSYAVEMAAKSVNVFWTVVR